MCLRPFALHSIAGAIVASANVCHIVVCMVSCVVVELSGAKFAHNSAGGEFLSPLRAHGVIKLRGQLDGDTLVAQNQLTVVVLFSGAGRSEVAPLMLTFVACHVRTLGNAVLPCSVVSFRGILGGHCGHVLWNKG